VTNFVSASGFPRIEKLEIEGQGFHTNLYAVRGNYFGGKEGKSKIQWLRSMVGSPDLISIPGRQNLGHIVISFLSKVMLTISCKSLNSWLSCIQIPGKVSTIFICGFDSIR